MDVSLINTDMESLCPEDVKADEDNNIIGLFGGTDENGCPKADFCVGKLQKCQLGHQVTVNMIILPSFLI